MRNALELLAPRVYNDRRSIRLDDKPRKRLHEVACIVKIIQCLVVYARICPVITRKSKHVELGVVHT